MDQTSRSFNLQLLTFRKSTYFSRDSVRRWKPIVKSTAETERLVSIIEIPFFETRGKREDLPSSSGVVIAYRSISNSRDVALPFMPIRAVGKKRRKEKKNWAQMTRASGVWASERADIFPALAAGCWFSRSVFSPLGRARRFHPPRPDSFPLSSSFLQPDFASGELFQVIHTRFLPSVPRTALSPRASTCARARGNLLCISLHRTAARPPARPPAANILFPLNYFINRVFASK